jgi:hypothetical protein
MKPETRLHLRKTEELATAVVVNALSPVQSEERTRSPYPAEGSYDSLAEARPQAQAAMVREGNLTSLLVQERDRAAHVQAVPEAPMQSRIRGLGRTASSSPGRHGWERNFGKAPDAPKPEGFSRDQLKKLVRDVDANMSRPGSSTARN